MQPKLLDILCHPFLLIQVGSYGKDYDARALPPRLAVIAAEREHRGEPTYPKSSRLCAPHYCIPADIDGILMNKVDELRENGVAYWAQNLTTRADVKGCVNANPRELVAFGGESSPFFAVLVSQPTTTSPKGSEPGKVFERWVSDGCFEADERTARINTDVVYTEKGKSTLLFAGLNPVRESRQLDINGYHVYSAKNSRSVFRQQFDGKRLPCRWTLGASCSLVAPGRPDDTSHVPLLKNPLRHIVAVAALHEHVCGRVIV